MSAVTLKNTRILITGAAGFIGSHLTKSVLRQFNGCEVIGLDNYFYGVPENLHGCFKNRVNHFEMIKGDVRDRGLVFKLIQEIDVLVHLAAEPFIPHCYTKAEDFLSTNIIGTMNLLQGCLRANIERFVYVSTSEVYGTAKYTPIDENHPTRPHSTYAATKLAAENLTYTFCKEHDIPAVIVRPFNTFGPRDSHPRVIPEIIRQLSKFKSLQLGNLTPSRDFTYVEDVADGIAKAVASEEAVGKIINLGYGKDIQIAELVEVVSEIMGISNFEVDEDVCRKRPFDVERLCADNSKAKKTLNWRPEVSIRDGLALTIAWYNNNGAHWRWEQLDYPYPYKTARFHTRLLERVEKRRVAR